MSKEKKNIFLEKLQKDLIQNKYNLKKLDYIKV